jgi:isopenicillin N synthase-like dioxygenase
VIDFRPFIDGSDKQGVADAIVESFKTTGFVYLINHTLPDKKVATVYEWVLMISRDGDI